MAFEVAFIEGISQLWIIKIASLKKFKIASFKTGFIHNLNMI